MNKKAQIGETMQDLVAMFVIIVIIIMFFIASLVFFNIGKGNIEIRGFEQSSYDQAHSSLLAYLQTPVEVEGEKMTTADLIRLSEIDEQYKIMLEEEMFREIYADHELEIEKEKLRSHEAFFLIPSDAIIKVQLKVK